VKEQSHKDEMSKALRGDFERLRERGVSVTLAPRDTAPPGPEPVESARPVESTETESTETVVEAGPEPEVEPPEAQAAEPEPDPEPEPETADEPVASDEPGPSEPGWLGRLFGR
jgi:hypothetical protein